MQAWHPVTSCLMQNPSNSLEEIILAACLMEATAPKLGNVHPGASFDDMTYQHFIESAYAVAPVLSESQSGSIGKTVLKAVQATIDKVEINTNLGIILLLAPLMTVPATVSLKDGIHNVLRGLTLQDAEHVYEAIRIANPGGMGEKEEADIQQNPTGTLLEMMQLAATDDQIANQYAKQFDDLFGFGLSSIQSIPHFMEDWKENIVWLQLCFLEKYSDSHVIRKCGAEVGKELQQRAADVLEAGFPESSISQKKRQEFDDWLRQNNNIRNPGTTADLITATLFIAFRERLLELPNTVEIIE